LLCWLQELHREKGCQGSEISRCMEELTVDEVMEVVNRQLRKGSAKIELQRFFALLKIEKLKIENQAVDK